MNDWPHLIVLYGGISDKHNAKQQRMIDGELVCMYRTYAEKYGEIIYLSSQEVRQSWEKCITDPDELMAYLDAKDAIIWSVKHDHKKDEVLKALKQKTLYYSCCARNCVNPWVTTSLVDDRRRMGGNAALWVKGKDPGFWYPIECDREFDYLLIGRRADKNEHFFLEQLARWGRERSVLWIGGEAHAREYPECLRVEYTPVLGPVGVRDNISRAKVGILFSEHPAEGFPQSYLEMTMCGVPVVYNQMAGGHDGYWGAYNVFMPTSKNTLLSIAEGALSVWDESVPFKVHAEAADMYSLETSYRGMILS